jgi:hypothetical protein
MCLVPHGTRSTGGASMTRRARQTRAAMTSTLVAVGALTMTGLGAAPSAAHDHSRPAVLRLHPGVVQQGESVGISVNVRRRGERRLVLQRRVDGQWQRVLRGRTREDGRWWATTRLISQEQGEAWLRVRVERGERAVWPRRTNVVRVDVVDPPPPVAGRLQRLDWAGLDLEDPAIASREGGVVFVRQLYGYRTDATLDWWNPRTGEVEHLPVGGNALDPSISDDGRLVAYEDGAGVSVLDRATGVSRPVPDERHDSDDPDLSSDGRWLAYRGWGDNTIYLDDLDDLAPARPVSPPERQSYSPPSVSDDGSRVVLVLAQDHASGEDHSVQLWEDGTLRPAPVADVTSPQISADGAHVLLARWDWEASTYTLWSWTVETGEILQVTDAAADTGTISASGGHVAFTSAATDLVPGERGDLNGVADLFRWSRASGGVERVTYLRTIAGQEPFPVTDPDISADGQQVAFTARADRELRTWGTPSSVWLWRSDQR